LTQLPELPAGTLTFLYTDLEGSTRLWEQHPQSMPAAMALHDNFLQTAVHKHGGRIFRHTGDGICAVFVNASAALAAALESQLNLQTGPWADPGPLRVRMALHTGEAARQGGDYSSPSLNRIGRLLDLAHGGQALLSQATQQLVRDNLPPEAGLKDMGEVRLRDLASIERVYQLTHPKLRADFPALASLDRRPNNLPSLPTPLIGRETELAEIIRRLKSGSTRMLTLTGPGGIGKTRLALQAAADLLDRFEHGVFMVELAHLRDPELVLIEIAHTTGMKEASDRSVRDELRDHLHQLKLLLILDNFEQVIAAGPLMADLLSACPDLHILATSREALHLRGEHIFPVPPLSLPGAGPGGLLPEQALESEAVRLFVERAHQVRLDFEVTEDNFQVIVEICRRLDGLPLAIELAAARLKLFSAPALLERLEKRLDMLRGGAHDLPLRQQTLRNTIAWSYDMLEQGERRLFELLSLFPGGAAFEAVETVAGRIKLIRDLGIDVLDGLSSLVDKSLVWLVEKEGGESRLLLLAILREYAAERLAENPEFKLAACRSHAQYYARFAQIQWKGLSAPSREAAFKSIETELDNLRAARDFWLTDRDLDQLSKMTSSLWMLYDARGWYRASIDLTTSLLDLLASLPPSTERARQEIILQTNLARELVFIRGGFTPDVVEAYNRAFMLSQQAGEVSELFPVFRSLAAFHIYQGDFQRGAEMGKRILSLAERLDDPGMRVEGHLMLGSSLAFMGDLVSGLEHFEAGISFYEPAQFRTRPFQFGSDQGVATLTTSALLLWQRGYPDQACERADRALALAESLKHPYSLAYALFHTGLLHYRRGEFDIVRKRMQKLVALSAEHQFQIWNAVSICLDGAALAGIGRSQEGLDQFQHGMVLYKGLKTPDVFWPELLYLQASICQRAGNPQKGLELVDEAINIITRGGGKCEPEYCRLKGELLLALSPENGSEAEQNFRQSLEVARERQAGMLVLRAAVSLGRYLHSQGRVEEARQLLFEAYQPMTEGFELADLREARTLLDELSQQA
jgi:predicted ATPase/class 3 adenylate cyclase